MERPRTDEIRIELYPTLCVEKTLGTLYLPWLICVEKVLHNLNRKLSKAFEGTFLAQKGGAF